MTYTVTHQTTHALPPAGTQNALDESHKKASTQQAARRTDVLARCRRAHGARLGRWRSQKHRWWPSAGVSGGGRDLTLRADDPTSRGTTQPGPTTQPNPKSTILLLGPRTPTNTTKRSLSPVLTQGGHNYQVPRLAATGRSCHRAQLETLPLNRHPPPPAPAPLLLPRELNRSKRAIAFWRAPGARLSAATSTAESAS